MTGQRVITGQSNDRVMKEMDNDKTEGVLTGERGEMTGQRG